MYRLNKDGTIFVDYNSTFKDGSLAPEHLKPKKNRLHRFHKLFEGIDYEAEDHKHEHEHHEDMDITINLGGDRKVSYRKSKEAGKTDCCHLIMTNCNETKSDGSKMCKVKKGLERCAEECQKVVDIFQKYWSKHAEVTGEETGEDYSSDYAAVNPLCASGIKAKNQLKQNCGYKKHMVCRTKDPLPRTKKYSSKTIEAGVFIDHHLYEQMENIIGYDSKKLKLAILKMVNRLFVQVETYLQHRTFSDRGGFRIRVNGVQWFKKPVENWDEPAALTDVLKQFQGFCNKINLACDAEHKSYDAMVLLTGKYTYSEISSPTTSVGFAFTGAVCKIAPSLTVTIRIDNDGNPTQIMSKLVAHELGHLLGSDHDGDLSKGHYTSFKGKRVPCPGDQNLMSPAVGMEMKTWSWCTKQMIGENLDARERNNFNCLLT